jgi:hypothetical protein
MPGRNGMGPLGQGPMTGGGRGWCGGAASRMEMPARGPGFGMGWGNGRCGGWRHRHGFRASGPRGWQRAQMSWAGSGAGFPIAFSKEDELCMLKQQAQNLEQTLSEIESRIQEIDMQVPDASEKERE